MNPTSEDPEGQATAESPLPPLDPDPDPAAAEPPHEPLAQPPKQPRWWRSATNRYVAGVFGGLGERFDVDPFAFRIIAVVLAVLTRNEAPVLVPLLYGLAWIILPVDGQRSIIGNPNRAQGLRQIAGIALLVALSSVTLAIPTLWVAGALALGAWILLAPTSDFGFGRTEPSPVTPNPTPPASPPPTVQPPPPDPEAAAASWGRRRRGATEPTPELNLPRPARRAALRQPALWPMTLALLVAWTGICFAIDRSTSPGLDPAIAVNGGLLIIGGVLALSAWRGRAGWTVLLAVALLPAWIAFSASDIGRYGGQGERVLTITEPPPDGVVNVQNGYGSILIQVEPESVADGRPLRIVARQTVGPIRVVVPGTSDVTIDSTIGLGGTDIPIIRSYHYAYIDDHSYYNEDDCYYDDDDFYCNEDPYYDDDGYVSRSYSENFSGLVVNGTQGASTEAISDVCNSVVFLPSDLAVAFAEQRGFDDPSEDPNFNDPSIAEDPTVAAFMTQYLGLPKPLEPVEATVGLRWVTHVDLSNLPCDPDNPPPATGPVQINATVGMGVISVEHRN